MQSSSILLITCREAGLQLSQEDLLQRKSVGFPSKAWPAVARLPRQSIGTGSFRQHGHLTRIVAQVGLHMSPMPLQSQIDVGVIFWSCSAVVGDKMHCCLIISVFYADSHVVLKLRLGNFVPSASSGMTFCSKRIG